MATSSSSLKRPPSENDSAETQAKRQKTTNTYTGAAGSRDSLTSLLISSARTFSKKTKFTSKKSENYSVKQLKYCLSPHANAALEELQQISADLLVIHEKCAQEQLQKQLQFDEKKKPLLIARGRKLRRIPAFWGSVIKTVHKVVGESSDYFLGKGEEDFLGYLVEIYLRKGFWNLDWGLFVC